MRNKKSTEEMIEYVLENGGMDIDQFFYISTNPLFLACEEKGVDMVELLIKRGANINIKNELNEDVFFYAVKGSQVNQKLDLLSLSHHESRVSFARGTWRKCPFLHSLRLSNKNGSINQKTYLFFLDRKADINQRMKKIYNCLFYPCLYGRIEDIKFLIEKGAEIDVLINKDIPFLFYCYEKKDELFDLVVEKGIDLNASDEFKRSVFSLCCIKKDLKTLLDLVNRKKISDLNFLLPSITLPSPSIPLIIPLSFPYFRQPSLANSSQTVRHLFANFPIFSLYFSCRKNNKVSYSLDGNTSTIYISLH
eukprot:TRINITY_DN4700_c0_g1_i4.p1 TRINITY_DN4700_c0_g1~~TRINITY_DN4700_c0_g1_i4.p1  ORF type:complete len:349 (-),score=76.17 TRINITY_DN4700_c0_g1_i4:567-1487(-)